MCVFAFVIVLSPMLNASDAPLFSPGLTFIFNLIYVCKNVPKFFEVRQKGQLYVLICILNT